MQIKKDSIKLLLLKKKIKVILEKNSLKNNHCVFEFQTNRQQIFQRLSKIKLFQENGSKQAKYSHFVSVHARIE